MLDRKFVTQNVDLIRRNVALRRSSADIDAFVAAEQQRSERDRALQEIRTTLNRMSKQPDAGSAMSREAVRKLKEQEKDVRTELLQVSEIADALLRQIPNLTHPDAPVGVENESREIYRSPRPITSFDFPSLDHKDLGEALHGLDIEAGTKVAKPGFYFLRGDLALLEIALMRFALDRVAAAGYEPHITPVVANDRIMEGTGYIPRGDESNTFTVGDDGLNLIATSEIVLCGMHADTTVDEAALPLRLAGVSYCFRTERASGRATRGLYRVHQFLKVEMVALCTPADGELIHQEMLAIERQMFDDLELPYRVLDIASGDLGGPAYRKFDIEVWMPHRGDGGEFGEVTSTSNCTDYQARRLNIRYRNSTTGKSAYLYTLNGTGLAVGRAMIGLLENNQKADRSVRIPAKLQPYFGKDVIAPRR